MSRYIWNILSGLVEPRCPSCPGDCSVVPSDGPHGTNHCAYFFIGEAPGRDEDSYSRPFIGRAGKEFNQALLPLAGLDRNMIYLTNTRKCRPPNNRKPSTKEVHACGGHFLPYELATVQPEVVILMGGTACSLLELDPRNKPIDLEVHHGRARQAYLFDELYWVFPTYHPALGLHDSNKIRHIRQDFIDLKRFLEHGFIGPTDQYKASEEYYLLGMDSDAPAYLQHCFQLVLSNKRAGRLSTLATDTESVQNKLWSWQVSVEPGKSIMGMATDLPAMQHYRNLLNITDTVVMHHAKHDYNELRKDGLAIGWDKIEDTMGMAYRLGESQGLKALAGRLCGMEMTAYMDVVKPYSREYVNEWLNNIIFELPSIPTTYVTPKKQIEKTKHTKNPLVKKITALLRDIGNKPDYDPWKSWSKFTANVDTEASGERVKGRKTFDQDKASDIQRWVDWTLDKFGDMPTVGLDKVPIKVSKRYACRDSDANLRVFHELDRMEHEFGKQVTQQDWDVIGDYETTTT